MVGNPQWVFPHSFEQEAASVLESFGFGTTGIRGTVALAPNRMRFEFSLPLDATDKSTCPETASSLVQGRAPRKRRLDQPTKWIDKVLRD